ncbi:transporter substrate-binding domain-containing protein [Bosea sp. 117]|uniref:transporter substrate-binding domain-containing protein n=1 Tax=Bosea sp. 117 TaxID=1125973 RepID=UPI000493D628|nr:transporter substrate-binding domain-containing protein [Bosea sp. 117]
MNLKSLGILALAAVLGTGAAVPAGAASLKDVKAKGTLVVGIDPTFSPFEFTDSAGKIVGYDPEIIEAVAKNLGLKVEYKVMPFSGILPALIAGGFDVTPTLNVTAERAKRIDYVIPTATSTNAVLAIKGGKVASSDIGALSGLTCAVKQTTQPEQMMQKLNKELEAAGKKPVELLGFETIDQTIVALADGRAQCVVDDKSVLVEAVGKRKDLALVVIGDIGGSTPIGWGVNKADADLTAALSAEVAKLKADGTVKKLQDKYFGYTMELPEKDFIPAQ